MKSETLAQFGVRATTDGRGFVLPVHSFTGTLVGVKIISVTPDETGSSAAARTHVTTRTIPRYVNKHFRCSRKHPLTFSPISPWEMCGLIQNFHGIFKMN